MHIPDGFLATPVWATLDVAAAPAVGYLARRAQQGLEQSKVPLLGVMGATLLSGGQGDLHAFILAFAGGAILTMLADTLIPEAFENAGNLAGLMTTFGFGLAFALSLLD